LLVRKQYDGEMQQPFSSRTNWDLNETAYAKAVREARASGRRLYDLTLSNPTECGFTFDQEEILAPLHNSAVLQYQPEPRGLLPAREAVAQYYADNKAEVNADEVLLTASTSEAYSFLFRLLCDAGDEVLVAQPSYPLFDFLADLDDVRLKPYPLFYDYGWSIDLHALEQGITPRTRAVLVVHPNNPTGQYASATERQALEAICARHGLALIVDEVFLDYCISESDAARAKAVSFAAGEHPVLTFVLSGLSKIAALPQMKVAWIVTKGPAVPKREALHRLEVIADTFLSMSAPIQHALPHWLAGRNGTQRQILDRIKANWQLARKATEGSEKVSCFDFDGGWSLVLKVAATESDKALALRLLEQNGLLTHPGSFYGFPDGGRLVISLITNEIDFQQGLKLLRGNLCG
jgi:alanine-synthesizing transaminase